MEALLSICTSNEGKRRECERMLGIPLAAVKLDLPELQSLDVEEVCRAKAASAFEQLGSPAFVDDTGFSMRALGGFPGALVVWTIKAGGTPILHRMLASGADPATVVTTAIGYADANGVRVFSGSLSGSVIAEPRGENGFGFDDVFVPEGESRTLAEMSDADKDAISPRSLALRKFAEFLREQGLASE